MVVRELQQLLARIYDTEAAHDVADFLLTDPRLAARLHPALAARETPETLLLEQDDEGVRVALYLDRELLRRLAAAPPFERLDGRNLEDFCTALEGVSHFACLTWNAARDRGVSLLGLELQAEVDKYAASLFVIGAQHRESATRGLWTQLFERFRYAEGLEVAARERYQAANHYAARFCRHLERDYLSPRRPRIEALLRRLRWFYRLPDGEKLRCAAA
jgi:hypothetical protein